MNIKKCWGILVGAVAAVIGLGGCGAPAPAEPAAQLPNPMVEAEGPEAFSELGVWMEAPEGASDVSYYIIDKTLAQVGFTLDDRAYVARAQKGTEDISGIYSPFEDKTDTIPLSGEGSPEITIKTVKESGEKLLSWQDGDYAFTLYVRAKADNETLLKIAAELGRVL